jgi:ribosome-associated toxin RatA of RatAB toxin-antitoxin module
VAFIVLLLAINQSKALAQADSINSKGIKQLIFERQINAPKQEVWQVISDVANYDKVAPNITAVKIIEGQGMGMVRSCSHNKDSWTETCTMWQEEKAYSFEVNTSAPEYPYPLKYLKGTWEVQEINSTTTKLILHFAFTYKHNYQNVLLHPFLKIKFKKTAEQLLDNWQKMLEQESK